MTVIPEDTWSRLVESRPTGDMLVGRRPFPELGTAFLAAVDSSEVRHLLIRYPADEPDFGDHHSRGVAVSTRDLTLVEMGPDRYIDVTCLDPLGHDAFDLIAGEIAAGLIAAELPAGQVVATTLARWRRFWGEVPHNTLSREAQLRLFGELWFMATWLVGRVGACEAVKRWRGPFGSRHDFEWLGGAVEVKVTPTTRGAVYRINGLEQLAPPESGPLHFFGMRVREEASARNSLPGIVAKCREVFKSDPESLDLLETGLARLQYSVAHEEQYSKLKLRVVEEALYAVTTDFPHLTSGSIVGGVPSGIEHVEYAMNLAGCGNLILGRSPSELPSTALL